MPLLPALTPHGALVLREEADGPALEAARAARLKRAFARGDGHGLFSLGADEPGSSLTPVFAYWRDLGARYVAALCALPDSGEAKRKPALPPPDTEDLSRIAGAAPPMTGAEYLDAGVLAALWRRMDEAFDAELDESKVSLQDFIKRRHPAWNLVGRVHFNLAENRRDEEAPFAFLATYTTRLSAQAKAQHLPLGKALHMPVPRTVSACCRS